MCVLKVCLPDTLRRHKGAGLRRWAVGEKAGDDKTERYLPPLQKGAMTFQQKGIQARAGWSKAGFDQSNFILTSLPILFHQPLPKVQFTSWAYTSLRISNNTINEPKGGAHKSSHKKNRA